MFLMVEEFYTAFLSYVEGQLLRDCFYLCFDLINFRYWVQQTFWAVGFNIILGASGKWSSVRAYVRVLGRMSSQDDLEDDASSVYMSHTGKSHTFDDDSNDFSD